MSKYMLEHSMLDIVTDLGKQKENLILESLNDLVSRGLLVIEETQPVLIQDYDSHTIRLSQKVRLVLKDQEYIERLEKENRDLKRKLTCVTDIVNDDDI